MKATSRIALVLMCGLLLAGMAQAQMKDEIEWLRSQLATDRQAIVAEVLALSDAEKVPLIGGRGILCAEQFDRASLDRYCELAEAARAVHKHAVGQQRLAELCRFRMALNLFAQPSSRTFMSFNTAQAWLGMNRMSVRDLKISSMSKGESLIDSVRTFISYVDVIVMRHPDDQAAYTAMWTSARARGRSSRRDCYVPQRPSTHTHVSPSSRLHFVPSEPGVVVKALVYLSQLEHSGLKSFFSPSHHASIVRKELKRRSILTAETSSRRCS